MLDNGLEGPGPVSGMGRDFSIRYHVQTDTGVQPVTCPRHGRSVKLITSFAKIVRVRRILPPISI
jgi:hypothetical protein